MARFIALFDQASFYDTLAEACTAVGQTMALRDLAFDEFMATMSRDGTHGLNFKFSQDYGWYASFTNHHRFVRYYRESV